MRAYEYDEEKEIFLGRPKFIIAGEMADGTKCWFKVDENGETIYAAWYTMHRVKGAMIAIKEGE